MNEFKSSPDIASSFAVAVKSELCAFSTRSLHCCRSELSGLVLTCGSISLGRGGLSLILTTEHSDVVTRSISLFERLYHAECELSSHSSSFKKAQTYTVRVSGRSLVMDIMQDLSLIFSLGISLDAEKFLKMTERECCKTSFLRGAYLGCGSVTHPNKDYHLEFVISMASLVDPLCRLLDGFHLAARISERREMSIVYLKDSESIIALLTRLGAYSSVMEFENIRIVKDIRNNVNRQINCENANIDRTVSASLEQINNIHLIEQAIGLDHLSPALREAAELRSAYPESSIGELAALSSDGVSKSGMNHRLRKLNEIALDCRKNGLIPPSDEN